MKIKIVKKGTSGIKKTIDCPVMIDAPSIPQK